MKRITSILSASGLVLALSLPSWAQTTLPTHNVTLAGTVETIDHGKRVVTLRTADGKFETIDVPPSAKRFDELKVGDKVSVTYNNSVSVRPKPPGEPAVDTGSKTSTMGQEVRPGGTTAVQRTVTATLSELPAAVAEAGLRAPAILLFGAVAARRDAIAWLERRPLHGKRVVVTRARAQASGLSAILRGLGADVVELPAIRIEPRLDVPEVREAVADLHSYALVCLTSPNGVRLLFEAMAEQGRDARALANATVAAIGPGTAASLAEHGVIADVVPQGFVAEALVEALAAVDVHDRPVLVARAAEARDVLPDALRERGARVDVVALYDTVREHPDPAAIEAAGRSDYVTFTSSSTVRNLLGATGDRFPRSARVVSIGPITSEAAREAGLEVHVEAERHDPSGVVEALVAARSRTVRKLRRCGR